MSAAIGISSNKNKILFERISLFLFVEEEISIPAHKFLRLFAQSASEHIGK